MKKIMPFVFVLFIALSVSCKKDSQSPERIKSEEIARSILSGKDIPGSVMNKNSDMAVQDELKSAENQPAGDEQAAEQYNESLYKNFYVPFSESRGRLVEYRINLTYETGALAEARLELLNIIAAYGFLSSSTSSTTGRYASVNSEFYIKSEKLYIALKEMEKIGKLTAENISAIDHTEEMVLKKQKITREQARIARREKAAQSAATKVKTWSETEESLTQSEDELDAAEHECWKINDRIAWAYVKVFIRGPEAPEKVEVPLYKNALVALANFFLGLLYLCIYAVPLIPVVILIWVKRRKIAGLFRKEKD